MRDMVGVTRDGFAVALRSDTFGDLHWEDIYFGSVQGRTRQEQEGPYPTLWYQLQGSCHARTLWFVSFHA